MWEEHLQHILIFCRVHIKRNFRKYFPNHDATYHLIDMWDSCHGPEEIAAQVQGICSEYPELKSWFKNKQAPWIAAGLSSWLSRIPLGDWKLARKETNHAESSHFFNNNFAGIRNNLLGSILK